MKEGKVYILILILSYALSLLLTLHTGILGATVMPHNLYLHSSLVQTRDYGESVDDKA